MKPYTYLIGWTKLNKWYYGAQYGKNSNPDNLWTTYFTSSKKVREIRDTFGEPDVIQVRKHFISAESCRRFEYKVLERLNAAQSEKWINQRNGNSKFYNPVMSESGKNKISEANRGKFLMINSEGDIIFSTRDDSRFISGEYISFSKFRISKLTKEEKTLIASNAARAGKGVKKSEAFREKIRKPKTKEHAENMKLNWNKRPILICPHCGHEGRGGAQYRYHFDNCKMKNL